MYSPPATNEAETLRTTVDNALNQLGWSYRPTEMVGIAGTVTTLCAIAQGLERYSSESVQGYRLTAAETLHRDSKCWVQCRSNAASNCRAWNRAEPTFSLPAQ